MTEDPRLRWPAEAVPEDKVARDLTHRRRGRQLSRFCGRMRMRMR
jgi:hypothetical protein